MSQRGRVETVTSPNSNLVSARMTPLESACSAARLYSSIEMRDISSARSVPMISAAFLSLHGVGNQ
jgi:hypothetical protein